MYHFRPYLTADRDACLRLFESNIPGSFLAHEIPDFLDYLERMPGPYLVCEQEGGGIVACGGLARRAGRPGKVVLCWGMVDREHQGRGIGRLLLRARLALALTVPATGRITMNTTQHTAPFFEKEGLRTVRVRKNFFAPGLHRHDMELVLDQETRERISRYACAKTHDPE
jgi:ribosomal protein S18 acetylase RimI-like enzyme